MNLFSVVQGLGYQQLSSPWRMELRDGKLGRQTAAFAVDKVNKIDRPNTTPPTVRGICTIAVYFSVFRPFCRFTLVYEGHFVLL